MGTGMLKCTGGLPVRIPRGGKRREHELRLAHGGVRIVVNVDALEKGNIEKGNTVDVWESCKVCSAKTLRSQVSDGT
jgi:1-phosphatidylinositol-3-phosphate 5-kinase